VTEPTGQGMRRLHFEAKHMAMIHILYDTTDETLYLTCKGCDTSKSIQHACTGCNDHAHGTPVPQAPLDEVITEASLHIAAPEHADAHAAFLGFSIDVLADGGYPGILPL
jgi:hypothetical protein